MAEEPRKGEPDKPVKVVKRAVKKPAPEAPAAAKPKTEAPKPPREALPKPTTKEAVPAKPAAKRPVPKRTLEEPKAPAEPEAPAREKPAAKPEKKPAAKPAPKKVARKERKPAKKEEKPAKKEPKAKEAEEEEEEHEARKKPELEAAVRTALRIRGLIASRRPTFYRQEWYRYKRLGLKWRKPQGGQSKLRRHLRYRINVVSIGFRGPKTARGLHPSGFQEVLVHTVRELKGIDPKRQAVRIAGTVGARKRALIQEEAEGLGLRILNRREA